jgi:hypothetical protein
VVVAWVFYVLHSAVFPAAPLIPTKAGEGIGFGPIAVLADYIRLLIWPLPLSMGHVYPAGNFWQFRTFIGLGLVAAGVVFVWRGPAWPRFATLWVGASLGPVLFSPGISYEHWLYLPALGVMLAIAGLLSSVELSGAARPIGAAALLAAIAFGAATWLRNPIWGDEQAFYAEMAATGSGLPGARGHAGLAILAADAGDIDTARAESERSLALVDLPAARINYGVLLISLGRVAEGKAELELGVAADPSNEVGTAALARAIEQENPERATALRAQVASAQARIRGGAFGLCTGR